MESLSMHLTRFVSRKTMAPRTRGKEIEYLRAFCRFAQERGWITDNPAKLLKPPRVDDVATMPYAREEIDKLLAACDQMQSMWKEDRAAVRQRARALVLTPLHEFPFGSQFLVSLS